MLSLAEVEEGLKHGMLVCGDSAEVLKDIPEGKIDLIYGDPTFCSHRIFNWIWADYDENKEILGFDDICKHGIKGYLSAMIPILKECWRTLSPTGSMYLHCDHHVSHYLKVEMDKIFGMDKITGEVDIDKGAKCLNTQITWRRCGSKGNAKMFANNSDYILFYSKDKEKAMFCTEYGDYNQSTLDMQKFDDNDGRGVYASYDISAPNGGGYKYDLGLGEKQPSGGYRWKEETMLQKIDEDLIIIKPGKVPRQKRYLSNCKGVPFDNVWTDIENLKDPEYPTEKPPRLMRRILRASSIPGDVVLDPFCGGGAFIREAQEGGRIAIGIDIATPAIGITNSRTHAPNVKVYGASEEDIKKYVKRNYAYDTEYETLRNKDPHEFQAWACQKFGGISNPKGADGGIDGYKYAPGNKIGIQVKRSDDITGPEYRLFKNDLRKHRCDNGVIIGFSFNGGAIKEHRSDMFDQIPGDVPIKLLTIRELLENEDAAKLHNLLHKKPRDKPLGEFFKIK